MNTYDFVRFGDIQQGSCVLEKSNIHVSVYYTYFIKLQVKVCTLALSPTDCCRAFLSINRLIGHGNINAANSITIPDGLQSVKVCYIHLLPCRRRVFCSHSYMYNK